MNQHEGNYNPEVGQPPCNLITAKEGRREGYSNLITMEEGRLEGYYVELGKFIFSADRENLDCKNR